MSAPSPLAEQLVDGTGEVGSIDGNRVELTGFPDPAEAAAAAWIAHVALDRRDAKRRREESPHLERPELYLVRSGEDEWIVAEGKRLARLVRPKPGGGRSHSNGADEVSAGCFGIEIVLPPDPSEVTIGSSAYVIYLALRRSGLRWSIRPAALTDECGRCVHARRSLSARARRARQARHRERHATAAQCSDNRREG